MPPEVQSNNIRNLLADLGYHAVQQPEETKALHAAIKKVDLSTLCTDIRPCPRSISNSPQAQKLARAFCDTHGHRFWPTRWPREQQEILRLMAHIITLKAVHYRQHRRILIHEKMNTRGETSVGSEDLPEDDMASPEIVETWLGSSPRGGNNVDDTVYVVTSHSGGTDGAAESSAYFQSVAQSSLMELARTRSHLASHLPSQEHTRQDYQKRKEHEQNPRKNPDRAKRVRFLESSYVEELEAIGETPKGLGCSTRKAVSELPTVRPESDSQSICGTTSNSAVAQGPKNRPTAAESEPSSSRYSNGTAKLPTNSPLPTPSCARRATPPISEASESSLLSSPPSDLDDLSTSAAQSDEESQPVLSPGTLDRQPALGSRQFPTDQISITDFVSRNEVTHTPTTQPSPSTPAQWARSSQTAMPSHFATQRQPSSSQGASGNPEQTEQDQPAPRVRNLKPNATFQAESSLVFILPKADKTLDYMKPVPASQIGPLKLQELFAFVSRRSEIPLEELDCLTFEITFANHENLFLQKEGDGTEWESLQAGIKRMYLYAVHKEKGRKEFQIFVESGDNPGDEDVTTTTYGGL